MTPAQKAANQRMVDANDRVIAAAKQIERASQYGADTRAAHEAYRNARADLWAARVEGWASDLEVAS